jgi:hypothetical protein
MMFQEILLNEAVDIVNRGPTPNGNFGPTPIRSSASILVYPSYGGTSSIFGSNPPYRGIVKKILLLQRR